MHFEAVRFHSRATNVTARVWVPSLISPEPTGNADDHYADIELENERRVAWRSVVSMAARFGQDARRRSQLGHDCAVFALACESSSDPVDQAFNQLGGKKVSVGCVEYIGAAPETTASLLLTSDVADENPRAGQLHHVMVRASADEGEPLYASVFGNSGRVILTDSAAVEKLYDVRAYYVISDLKAEPLSN